MCSEGYMRLCHKPFHSQVLRLINPQKAQATVMYLVRVYDRSVKPLGGFINLRIFYTWKYSVCLPETFLKHILLYFWGQFTIIILQKVLKCDVLLQNCFASVVWIPSTLVFASCSFSATVVIEFSVVGGADRFAS